MNMDLGSGMDSPRTINYREKRPSLTHIFQMDRSKLSKITHYLPPLKTLDPPLLGVSAGRYPRKIFIARQVQFFCTSADEAEEDPLALHPSDSVDKETIDLAISCLITASDETIDEELLLKPVSTGYRTQKATTTIRDRIAKLEAFSNYLMSPLKKSYRTFFMH